MVYGCESNLDFYFQLTFFILKLLLFSKKEFRESSKKSESSLLLRPETR